MNDTQTDLPHDGDLEVLGVYLRVQAQHHPGDLPGLLGRARVRRTRVRLASTLVAALVVVGVGAALVGRAGHGDGRIQVLRPAATTSTTPWTVNDSLVPRAPQLWALQVVYDPATSSYEQVANALGLLTPRSPVSPAYAGMASYKDLPELQIYWTGDDGQADALAAQATLLGRPGIVSAQVGLAHAH